MRLKTKTKKLLSASLSLITLFSLGFQTAYAVSIPSVNDVAEKIEKRYQISRTAIQDSMRSFNVSDNKTSAPEVFLSFNPSDPKPGQEVTALAHPSYFKTPNEKLYYTWYIVHDYDDLEDYESIDYNDNDKYCRWAPIGQTGREEIEDIEDCKIEAAKILAKNYFDKAEYIESIRETSVANAYPPTSSNENLEYDGDGYRAYYGGDTGQEREKSSEDVAIDGLAATDEDGDFDDAAGDFCYVRDFKSGEDYEIADISAVSSLAYTNSDFSQIFEVECSADSSATGGTGGDSEGGTGGTGGSAEASAECESIDEQVDDTETNSFIYLKKISGCKHLFPKSILPYNGNEEILGNFSFRSGEEYFWNTNPQDPDTLDRGSYDEASILGMGMDSFTWNYRPGDLVGVAVEGESLIQTTYNNSSYQVMWALPKNQCREVENADKTYFALQTVYNSDAEIPGQTDSAVYAIPAIEPASLDMDDCLDDNLVDPREGGQPTLIKPVLSYYPENPVNYPSESDYNDVLFVQANASGSEKKLTDLYTEWSFYVNTRHEFTLNEGHWNRIRPEILREKGIGATEGIGIDNVSFKLNFTAGDLELGELRNTEYIKAKLKVKENYSSDQYRSGMGEVVIKLNSSPKGIDSYIVTSDNINDSNPDNLLLSLPGSENLVCDQGAERSRCPVTKYDIVGLYTDPQIDNDGIADLENFSWTINGTSFSPTKCFYTECVPGKINNYAYFPVLKDPGEEYVVKLAANNIKTGETVEYTKTFEVVEPYMLVKNPDSDNACWPKLLGEYSDLDGNNFTNKSANIFQTSQGSSFSIEGLVHPTTLESTLENQQWFVDGILITEENQADLGFGVSENKQMISITNQKLLGEVYNIKSVASLRRDTKTKKALSQIWGLSITDFFEESEIENSIQVETVANAATASEKNPKLLANIFSQVSGQLGFLLRILLATATMLIVSAFVFSLNDIAQRKKL